MDLTSVGDRDWLASLMPFLREAYVQRAVVVMVLIGDGGSLKLRAEKFVARSVLAKGIREAFDRPAGAATPLAHGLELARQALQELLHRGRSAAASAKLVVVTDGRGNVPLLASYTGQLELPVRREGIDDSLAVAERLAVMPKLETLLLDPRRPHTGQLVTKLADALEAQQIPIFVEAGDVA